MSNPTPNNDDYKMTWADYIGRAGIVFVVVALAAVALVIASKFV